MKHPPQERDIVPGRAITGVAAGVVVSIVVGVLVAYAIGRCGGRSIEIGRLSRNIPDEVNAMEMAPYSVEAQGLEANQRAEAYLSTYGWIDRERGIVHIPIEAAIRSVLARQGGQP